MNKAVADPGGCRRRTSPPKGPDSFVLTYKIFRNGAASGVGAPLRGWRPPTGNPGSAAVKVLSKYFYKFIIYC